MSQILNRIEREMKHQKRSPAQIWTRRISLVILCLAIPIMGAELFLRLTGYHRPQVDFSAQVNSLHKAVNALNTRFESEAFEFDPHRLWKLKPGSNLGGLNVNENGLLSWPAPDFGPRKMNPIRVLCLGDSVTAMTYRTYPEITERLASAAPLSRPIVVYNAAVPGYTTEQALRLMPDLRKLAPDVVVFCFGWNDHFPALTLPDRELGAANFGSRFLHNTLKDVRLYQLFGAPLGARQITKASPSDDIAMLDTRVPPSQFRENLERLVTMTRSWSALPIVATQPENLDSTAEQFLEGNHFIAPDNRNNRDLHSHYNQIVREVSVGQRIPLLDIEAEFVRRPRDFMLEPDGIHLTGRGHNHVARLILGALKNENQITSADYDSVANAEKHDTTAPDKPRVTWTLIPSELSAPLGQPFSFTVIPQNSGNTRWLKRNVIPKFNTRTNVSYGSTSIFTRWRTVDPPTTGIVSQVPIPSDVLPGEATSITLTMHTPEKPGNYELEVGIMADEIGPLTNYGAESTTLTVSAVRNDNQPPN